MRKDRGLTVTELMVAVAVIGIGTAVTVPYTMHWLADYRFYAMSQAFINAAQSVRVRAIGGSNVFELASVEGSSGSPAFVFKLKDFTFGAVTYEGKATFTGATKIKVEDLPVKVGDYVILTGFSTPIYSIATKKGTTVDTSMSYLNGNLFKVTKVEMTDATAKGSQWTVTGMALTCDGGSVTWGTGAIPSPQPQSATTTIPAKVQVAASVKFTAEPYAPEWYRVDPDPLGNSMSCIYDSQRWQVTLYKRMPDTATFAVTTDPIVFDSTGATMNHAEYKVDMNSVKKSSTVSGTDSQGRPVYAVVPDGKVVSYSVLPSGKIKYQQ